MDQSALLAHREHCLKEHSSDNATEFTARKYMEINKKAYSVEDIAKIEDLISVELPKEYKEFLLREYRISKKNIIKWGDEAYQNSCLSDIFSLKQGQGGIAYYYKYYVLNEKRIPFDLLPIGADDGGNLFCLGIDREFYGRIYFWDHEHEGSLLAVIKIADDFNSFISLIEENRDFARDINNDFYYYISKEDYDSIEEMFLSGVDPNYRSTVGPRLSLLEFAVLMDCIEAVEIVLKYGGAESMQTALNLAVTHHKTKSISVLEKYL